LVEAWAYRDLGHLPSQVEEQYSGRDGAEAVVDLDDPNLGPDLEVVLSVVEGFALDEEDCLVSRAAASDTQLHQRSLEDLGVDVVKHFAHAELPLSASPVLAQSSVVASGDRPKACGAYSEQLALFFEALEQTS